MSNGHVNSKYDRGAHDVIKDFFQPFQVQGMSIESLKKLNILPASGIICRAFISVVDFGLDK